jgi:carbon-monoxide dehydrogenase small subunit
MPHCAPPCSANACWIVASPSEADIREGLAGNICRCTGYVRIFESVVRAIELERVGRGHAK